MSNLSLFLLGSLIACTTALAAVDNGADQTLAAGLLQQQPDHGKQVWLESNGQRFLALSTESVPNRRHGGIILVHDYGEHLDSPSVIGPLRSQLPDARWQTLTLSIQLPTIDHDRPLNQHNYPEFLNQSLPRLTAAINHLTTNGIYNIVLLGHGIGATVIAQYLGGEIPENQAAYIKGFVAIGTRTPDFLTERQNPKYFLERTRLPVFDVLSSRETPAEIAAAKQRKTASQQAKNAQYRQWMLLGVDPRFQGSEDTLVHRVKSWLARYARGVEVDLSVKK